MIRAEIINKIILCLFFCQIVTIKTHAQFILIKDSINHEKPIGFIYKSSNSNNNQKIFSNCRIEHSSDSTKFLTREYSNAFDTNARFTIYNDSGVVERKFEGPNLYGIILRNDGAIIIYGCYHSYAILLDTYFYAYNNDGTLIRSSPTTFGPSITVNLFDNENYLFFMADSIGGNLISKKRYVMVYDKNFNLLSKSIFDDDHSKHYFQLDSIDEQNKLIHFFYTDRQNKREKEFNMTYSGKITN